MQRAVPYFYLLPVLVLGYGVSQTAFPLIFVAYSAAFGLYFWVVYTAEHRRLPARHFANWMWIAVLARVALLGSMPALSDDVYRFIWDGRLAAQGLNVFAHLPAWYMQPGHEVPGLTQELFDALNSPAYFTIYPPVAQAVFRLAAHLFPESIWGSTLVIRLFLLICELGSLLLLPRILRKLKQPAERSLIYALNPLVVVEITGNLHFEGAMVFFFLLFVWWWLERRKWLSAAAMALSIASKLLPLMLLPLLTASMWQLRSGLSPNGIRLGLLRDMLLWLLALGGLLALLFLPFFSPSFFVHFGESLDLYFRKFEFNASVYYLLRALRYWQLGYNDIHRIGPLLGVVVLLGVLGMSWWSARRRSRSPEESVLHFLQLSLWAFVLYLLLATTVHPWYLVMPILLAGFSTLRFPLWWSYAASWSYINYSYSVYRENLWVVALEYVTVLLFFWMEYKKRPRLLSPDP